MTHPIYPCLWFNQQAKTAAEFYCTVFKNARITAENPLVVTFDVGDRRFMCLNGGPEFQFNEAVSFVIECDTQEEIDYYWEALSAGGSESQCGWLKDRFGVAWQVVPAVLPTLLADPERAKRVVPVFLRMKKFDLQALIEA